jgi:hypothetical protein
MVGASDHHVELTGVSDFTNRRDRMLSWPEWQSACDDFERRERSHAAMVQLGLRVLGRTTLSTEERRPGKGALEDLIASLSETDRNL